MCAALPAQGGLTAEQAANAALIVDAAGDLDLSPDSARRAAVIAIAVALQESGLRNIPYGDRDSLGLFQQRPSQGWGTPELILNPAYATRRFYSRLLRVPGWEALPVAEAAQAVQRSAFPAAYARHEPRAVAIVARLTGACPPESPVAAVVIAYAHAQLGRPYRWGAQGPDAFDCSGLTMRAYQAAGLRIPRVTFQQWRYGSRIAPGRERPGDLVFLHMTRKGPSHVGLVIGGGLMIHAPHRGDVVKVAAYTRSDVVGFVRPWPSGR